MMPLGITESANTMIQTQDVLLVPPVPYATHCAGARVGAMLWFPTRLGSLECDSEISGGSATMRQPDRTRQDPRRWMNVMRSFSHHQERTPVAGSTSW